MCACIFLLWWFIIRVFVLIFFNHDGSLLVFVLVFFYHDGALVEGLLGLVKTLRFILLFPRLSRSCSKSGPYLFSTSQLLSVVPGRCWVIALWALERDCRFQPSSASSCCVTMGVYSVCLSCSFLRGRVRLIHSREDYLPEWIGNTSEVPCP